MREADYGDRKPLLKFISKEIKMTKYIDRYYLNWELYGIKFGGEWWQPWANTLAYYPLTSVSTTSDLSWNNYDLTNDWNTQFWTYAGVDCAYINFNWRTALSNSTLWGQIWTNAPFTYSAWVNSMYVNSERGILSCYKSWAWDEDRAITIMNDGKIRFYINSGGAHFAYTSSISANTWYYIVGTLDWTDMKVYLNAVLSETTASWYTTDTSSMAFAIWTKHPSQSNAFEWYVSDVIIENKARTAQEIEDYYNQTKFLYWIS